MAFGRRKRTTKKNTSKSSGKIKHEKTVIDGITFDSKMESKYYQYLKAEKKAGRVIDIILQPEYILQPKFFIYEGQVILEDDPSYKEYNKKRLAFNKTNPDKKINIIQAIKYRSDFEVTYADGSKKTIDPKGIKTADFKLKEKMLRFKYPHIDFMCVILDEKTNTWLEYSEWEAQQKAKKKAKKAIKK